MKRMYLDIETLPADGEKVEILQKLWQDIKKKNQDKPRKEESTFESFFRNTSFQGEFGRILCISYAIDDEKVECLVGDEKEILKDFWELAKDINQFIGHNIMEFDLRFIYKRSIIHGIKPSRELSFARYRSEPIFDTMKEWEKWGAQGISLHRLTTALGITSPKEEGIDGSKVYDYFLAGRIDEIVEYCKRDVEATRAVHRKMTFQDK